MRYFNNDIFSCPGDKIIPVYSPVVTEDGHIEIVESGKEDLNAYIQSFAAECKIENIIERFMCGDTEAIDKAVGMYGDFTDAPKTYAEFLQMQIDVQKSFDSLPKDIKLNFDNDVTKYVNMIGSEDWFKCMNIDINKKVEEIEEGSKDE